MNTRIDLNGTWKLRWTDHQRGGRLNRLLPLSADMRDAIDATVPGEVHLDLVRAGLIQEPTVGLNVLAARWVEENIWRYRRVFAAPSRRADARVLLVFECLDLAATIYLNGSEVGCHCNSFYPCSIDVTEHLVDGENVLVVEVEAGLYYACDKPFAGYTGAENTLSKRHWLRKTQSEFGWDWAPRLGNVGILGDVYLEVASTVHVGDVVTVATLDETLKKGSVKARVAVTGLCQERRAGRLEVSIEGLGVLQSSEVEIGPGYQILEAAVDVSHPNLWWPAGHGTQPLYEVTVTLSVEGEDEVAVRTVRRVGFRHVRVNQDVHPESGQYFIVEVNGKRIFIKGGNLVPADIIPARLDTERYEGLVARALEANFNLLRVWGGGLYESDLLYDLCDEKGILVWQEFVFACSRYPGTDDAFLADVKREATHQVRRLAHHPSLLLWCGNNEMEWGNYGGYDRGVAHPDYAIFHLVLPRIVNAEDGSRFYLPSSPFSPGLEDPNRDDRGDQHPWSVGFANTDFRDYRKMTCRFPNEGGILGPTALPTVKACLVPGQEWPGSFAWEQHENSIAYLEAHNSADAMVEQWVGRDVRTMSIEDYVYYAGIVHGEGLAEYIRNFRRRMFDSASAVFWMYNDCWPMVRSWTIVDYYLRRTPAFHPVRRAFLPLVPAIVVEGDKVRVYGVNDGDAFTGTLRFGLFALSGGMPSDETLEVRIPANASVVLAEFDFAEWERLGLGRHGAFAILSHGGREVARDRLFMPTFRELEWPAAEVEMRLEEGRAVFTSATFAWRVCLDLDGEQALPDNFFDILPGLPTVLEWPAKLGEPRILKVGNLTVC